MSELMVNSKGRIVLRSIKPIKEKITIASIGGFCAYTKDDDLRLPFDWDKCSGNLSKDKEGHALITWELDNFNTEDYNNDWEDEECLENVNLDDITAGLIDEITYEAYAGEENPENFVEMEVVEFAVGDYINKDDDKMTWKHFSKEQIDKYNEKMANYRVIRNRS